MQKFRKSLMSDSSAVRFEYFFVAAALLFTVCAAASVVGSVLR
jgi:hypothetical protein